MDVNRLDWIKSNVDTAHSVEYPEIYEAFVKFAQRAIKQMLEKGKA